MDLQPGGPAEEIKRLQRCINDLVSLLALPAIWSGSDQPEIIHTLLDALRRVLELDLMYVRLKNHGQPPIEVVRIGPSQESRPSPEEIGAIFSPWLDEEPL